MKSQKKLAFVIFTATLFLLPLLDGIAHLPGSIDIETRELIDEHDYDKGKKTNPLDIGLTIAEIPTTTSGDGSLLPVTEYAEGLFDDRTARANDSSTYYPETYEIPAGWKTSEIVAVSSKIYHLQDWVSNGDFASITDWNAYEYPSGIGEVDEQYDSLNDWIEIVRPSGGKVKYDYWG